MHASVFPINFSSFPILSFFKIVAFPTPCYGATLFQQDATCAARILGMTSLLALTLRRMSTMLRSPLVACNSAL